MRPERPSCPLDPNCSATLHIARTDSVVWAWGAVTDNRTHKHQALQVNVAGPGCLARLRVGEEEFRGPCSLVDGGVPHSLELQQGLVALVDSASALARSLRTASLRGAPATNVDTKPWDGSLEHGKSILRFLGPNRASMDSKNRVQDVLAWLDELEGQQKWFDVSLQQALAISNLSRSRFLHVFSTTVGSPWRTYLIWRRALVAISLVARGSLLTAAAHAAGYSDLAHLSRQFTALFGIAPSKLARDSHFVQA